MPHDDDDIAAKADAFVASNHHLRREICLASRRVTMDAGQAWWEMLSFLGPRAAVALGLATLEPSGPGCSEAKPTPLGSAVACRLLARATDGGSTVRVHDAYSGGDAWLLVREGIVVGAMGCEPERFLHKTIEHARAIGERSDGGKVTQ